MGSSRTHRLAAEPSFADVMERLLDAHAMRTTVRSYAVGLIAGMEKESRRALEPLAAESGGSSVAFSALWFLERFLVEGGVTRDAMLDRCRRAICVTLIRCMLDDVASGDRVLGPAHVAYLAALAAGAAFGEGSADGRALEAVQRGERFGGLFEAIAAEGVEQLWPPERAGAAIEAMREFGELCAQIDDWLDAELDFSRGAEHNVVLLLLRERCAPHAPKPGDLTHHRAWLRDQLDRRLTKRVTQMAASLKPFDFPGAIDALSRVVLRIPATLDTTAFRSRPLLRSV